MPRCIRKVHAWRILVDPGPDAWDVFCFYLRVAGPSWMLIHVREEDPV